MKKNIPFSLVIIFILLSFYQSNAQTYAWAKAFGGPNFNEARNLAVDSSGNVYIVGYFTDTIDLDPGPSIDLHIANGYYSHAFVVKLDSTGNYLWAKTWGGNGESKTSAEAISVDENGNIYIGGSFTDTVDFNPGPDSCIYTANGEFHIYIEKLDSNGNFLWVRTWAGSSHENMYSIIYREASIYILGALSGTLDFDPGPDTNIHSSNGFSDVYVMKLDTNGNFIWAKTFGGPNEDFGNSFVLDKFGNIYLTGFFSGIVDFDPGSGIEEDTSYGMNPDVFIEKLDSNGNFIWVKTFGGTGSEGGDYITIDKDGNSYTLGFFSNTLDFDPGVGTEYHETNGSSDIFIEKLDFNGNFIWVKTFGGNENENGYAIKLDSENNIYILGDFFGTVDFDPGPGVDEHSSIGLLDFFIEKLDINGNYKWTKTLGSKSYEYVYSMATDNMNNIYVVGSFSDTIDFDPGSGINEYIPVGLYDGFILKMHHCSPIFGEQQTTSCNSYTWNGNTYYSSGDYIDTIFSVDGCDSIVTLHLTINTVNVSINVSGDSLIVNEPGANYQWIDCSNNLPINGENNQWFIPDSDGYYAVIVDNGLCTDTSDCISFHLSDIIKNTFDNKIKVSPNPTKGEIAINLGNIYSNVQITLKDITGRILETKNYPTSKMINFTIKQPNGIYLLEIKSNEKKAVIKILKE